MSASLVAAVQMVSGPDVARNCADAGRLVAEAARRGAALVVLPEYFPLMGMSERDKIAASEPEGEGPIQRFLAETAARHGVWLVGGSVPLAVANPDKVSNSCLVFDPSGSRVARYDKVHLFDYDDGVQSYKESETIEPGSRVSVFEAPLGRIGLSICYDLRFPELYRAMGVVDLIVVPAAFTYTTGQAHWELLLRARAVENQCYVVSSAQGGHHANGRVTYGHSMIVDPWGEVLDRLDSGPGLVAAPIDRERLEAIRRRLPALAHRRM
ncbi:MAG: carbon-nitrogen hydrolase family protein [Rhodocyclaceae bacterium]